VPSLHIQSPVAKVEQAGAGTCSTRVQRQRQGRPDEDALPAQAAGSGLDGWLAGICLAPARLLHCTACSRRLLAKLLIAKAAALAPPIPSQTITCASSQFHRYKIVFMQGLLLCQHSRGARKRLPSHNYVVAKQGRQAGR
jgi:hypothetical protein